jgi:hypothetical protein
MTVRAGNKVTAAEPSPNDSNLHLSGVWHSNVGDESLSFVRQVDHAQVLQPLKLQLAILTKQHRSGQLQVM